MVEHTLFFWGQESEVPLRCRVAGLHTGGGVFFLSSLVHAAFAWPLNDWIGGWFLKAHEQSFGYALLISSHVQAVTSSAFVSKIPLFPIQQT
ncbi:hypothetical protein, partial [Pontibacter silvestris]